MIIPTIVGLVLVVWPNTRWLGLAFLALGILYATMLVGRWREHARLMSKPHLDVRIDEAHIVPSHRAATCFLRVSLHNEIGASVANPPATAYKLQIRIKGTDYPATVSLDPHNYELGTYKRTVVFDDEEPRDGLTLLTSEMLLGLSMQRGDLVPGNPKEG